MGKNLVRELGVLTHFIWFSDLLCKLQAFKFSGSKCYDCGRICRKEPGIIFQTPQTDYVLKMDQAHFLTSKVAFMLRQFSL